MDTIVDDVIVGQAGCRVKRRDVARFLGRCSLT